MTNFLLSYNKPCFQCNIAMTNFLLSHNKPCCQCNAAITNFLVSNTYEIRFDDVIGQSSAHMHPYAKILKHG